MKMINSVYPTPQTEMVNIKEIFLLVYFHKYKILKKDKNVDLNLPKYSKSTARLFTY